MPFTDPSILSNIAPPQNPLEQYGRVLALKNAMAQQALQPGQQQLQQQQVQEGQMTIDRFKALNQAYSSSIAPGEDGKPVIDTGKLTQALSASGQGSQIPTVLKGVQDYQKSSADLSKAQDEVAALQQDAAGSLAATVKSANNDPLLFTTLLQHAVAAKHIDPAKVAPYIQQVQQSLEQDPTGKQASAMVGKITDQLIAGSPEQQKLLSERTTAQAHQTEAATAAAAGTAKLPGEQAQSAQAVRANLAAQLGAAANPAEYQKILGAAPFEVAKEFDGKTPEQARKLGMTSEQQTQAGQAATNEADTQANRKAELSQGQQRIGIEKGRGAREQAIYDQTYGAGANTALQGVEPKLRTAATSAAQKAADDYGKAAAAQRDMQTFLDLAKSGNKEAHAYLSPEGVLTLNTSRGVTRVNRQEIEAYSGAGSLFDNIAAKVGKLTSGQSIPADVLSDISALHQQISNNSDTTYQQKLDSINQNYHSNFKPVPKVAAPAISTAPHVSTKAQFDALPKGAIYTEDDGKQYKKP